jgi:hypothetical protein
MKYSNILLKKKIIGLTLSNIHIWISNFLINLSNTHFLQGPTSFQCTDSKDRENERTKSNLNLRVDATLAIRVVALSANQITLSPPIYTQHLIPLQAQPFKQQKTKSIKARVRVKVKVSVPFSRVGFVNRRDEFDGWRWWRVDQGREGKAQGVKVGVAVAEGGAAVSGR